MSFTADIYKEILFDISAGTNQTQPFAMRRTAFNNGIVAVSYTHLTLPTT